MKDSDLSSIELNSDAFTKKWWETRRSIFASGSGVGKALDLWQKNCKKKIDQMTTDDRIQAEETCNTLRKAMLTAKKKVGIKDKATVKACDAYLKIIDQFANDINKAGQKQGGSFDAEQELTDQLLKFTPLLKSTAKSCLELESLFDKKSALYSKWEKEANSPMDPKNAEERKKEIVEEELLISNEMKKFGKWNNAIIGPWKELKTHVIARKVENAPKIKAALRVANGEYDIYVDAMGKGQDLGQDHLHTLRRLIQQLEGKTESTEEVKAALLKLKQQLSDKSFGCGSKIEQQVLAITEVLNGMLPLKRAIDSKQPLPPEIREAAQDLKTKASQIEAIAQANYRAMLRLKATVAGYAKTHGKIPSFGTTFSALLAGIKKGEKDFETLQTGVRSALDIIKLTD